MMTHNTATACSRVAPVRVPSNHSYAHLLRTSPGFAAYSPTTGPVAVVALVIPLVLAASGWGMFIGTRLLVQLLMGLGAQGPLAQRQQQLAHRISLMALHGRRVKPWRSCGASSACCAMTSRTSRPVWHRSRR
jgi:hypothetical protein